MVGLKIYLKVSKTTYYKSNTVQILLKEVKHSFGKKLKLGLVVVILNFGCEVVSDVPNLSNVVLNHQWHVGGHGEGHLGGQTGSLGEHVQVPERDKVKFGSKFETQQIYLQAKVSVTGSCISIVTASSSLSTLAVWASLMLPTPISPAAENLTPSLVQEMTTDSPNCDKSRT